MNDRVLMGVFVIIIVLLLVIAIKLIRDGIMISKESKENEY